MAKSNVVKTTKEALKKASDKAKQLGKKVILYIPKDYEGQGSSLNALVNAADALGIEAQHSEKNSTALTKELFGTAENIFGVTERGLALFAPQVDKVLQKHQKIGNKLGSANAIGDSFNKAQGVLSTLQNFLGSALSGIDLDDLVQRRKNGEEISDTDLAQASINLVNQLVDSVVSVADNVDTFSSNLNKLGEVLSHTKHFGAIGNKLKNLPDLGKLGLGLEAVSGILSAISAAFILGNEDAHQGTKAAAGIELTTKILGNVGKSVSQYMIAQRAAAGLSTTAATAGLITSVVALAISPLSFLSVADKFERAKQLESFSTRFKQFGYEGDSLLASFHKQSGTIEAAVTTITTVLSAVSAGVGAAATGSLIGAPITALVSAVTGIITGVLDASKQAMFESVANQLAGKISAWEKKYGKNYFENGYDSRQSAFLEDSFKLLSEFNQKYDVERAVAITQQRWDQNIGELAGITRNGARIQSGKTYVDYFEEGKRLQSKSKDFTKQVFDPVKGVINLSESTKSTLLTFVTPTLTTGEEVRTRKQTGKYEYITQLVVNGTDKWVMNGVKKHDAVYDYSNLIQHINTGSRGANQYRELRIESVLGEGNDKVFVGSGSSTIFAGEGHDVVYYNKGERGNIVIDGTIAKKAGDYTVSRELINQKILTEVTKTQDVSVGKRTERIHYRDYDLQFMSKSLTATDNLHSVEEIIGGNYVDWFKGSRFKDVFHGAGGDDRIEGNEGNDRLYGEDGNDAIWGGNGDDQLYGGLGNDKINGGLGHNYLNGGIGNDELQTTGTGKDVLLGGKGNDKLYSNAGEDLLDGGEGNDYLNGGENNDIYQYRKAYGRHIIEDNHGSDKLSITDISFRDIALQRQGNNLVLNTHQTNAITIKDWFVGSVHRIEEIIDKDGRKLTAENIDKYITETTSGKSKWLGNYYSSSSDDALVSLSNDISKIVSSAGSFGDLSQKEKVSSGLVVNSNSHSLPLYHNALATTA